MKPTTISQSTAPRETTTTNKSANQLSAWVPSRKSGWISKISEISIWSWTWSGDAYAKSGESYLPTYKKKRGGEVKPWLQDLLQEGLPTYHRRSSSKIGRSGRVKSVGANKALIDKFAKSRIITDDGQSLRKDVMSKTLIWLLKRFVMNAHLAEIPVT